MREKANEHKIKELQDIIDAFSNRQKQIRAEIQLSSDEEYKNDLGVERQTNTAILRIAFWMMMELKGYSFERKIKADAEYPRWVMRNDTYYYNEFMANIFNIKQWKRQYGGEYKYWYIYRSSQKGLFNIMYDKLFPEIKKSIFDFNEDNSIENEIWRDHFSHLIKNDWDKYKARYI